jgi:hypothetical protein
MLVDPECFELFEDRAPPKKNATANLHVRQASALHPGIYGPDGLIKPSGDLGFIEKSFVSRSSGWLTLRCKWWNIHSTRYNIQ